MEEPKFDLAFGNLTSLIPLSSYEVSPPFTTITWKGEVSNIIKNGDKATGTVTGNVHQHREVTCFIADNIDPSLGAAIQPLLNGYPKGMTICKHGTRTIVLSFAGSNFFMRGATICAIVPGNIIYGEKE